jgi:hypothetical protein
MTGKLIPPTKTIITQINAAHDAVVESGKSSLTNAIRAGELLVSAKECVEHGAWTQWLDDNCPDISEETARLYMRLAKNEDEIEKAAEQNGNAVADLSVRGAAKLLSKPLTEEQKAARAASLAKKKAEAAKKKPAGSADLKDLMQNCGADEIERGLRDADKLEEVATASIANLPPDKVYDALTKAWTGEQLHDLIKRLTLFVESLTTARPPPSTAPSVTRRPVVVS